MSIVRDKITGKYNVVYRVRDIDGRIKQSTKRGFETKELAIKFECEVKLGMIDFRKKKLTFEVLYNMFVDDCKMRLKYSTIESYNYKYKKYLIKLASRDVYKITYRDLDDYVKKLYLLNVSGEVINKLINLLSKIYDFGNKKIDLNYNPTIKLEKVKNRKQDRKVDFFTKEEFEKFILSFSNKDYMFKVMFMVLYYTGLRCGELQALDVSDIDLKNNVIHITKNYCRRSNGKYEITTTKTKASDSVVYIPKVLREELIRYIDSFKLKGNDYLFNYNGDRVKKRTIENYKNRYCDISNVKRIRIHDFRHSFASLIYELSNYNFSEVASRLRHSDASTCMKTYVHVFPMRKKEIDSKLDQL